MSELLSDRAEKKEKPAGAYDQTFYRDNFGILDLDLGNDEDKIRVSIVEDPAQPCGFYIGGEGIKALGGEVALHEGKNILGRCADCDIVIADAPGFSKVSRYHLGIELSPDRIHIEDLSSTNGTYAAPPEY